MHTNLKQSQCYHVEKLFPSKFCECSEDRWAEKMRKINEGKFIEKKCNKLNFSLFFFPVFYEKLGIFLGVTKGTYKWKVIICEWL